MIRAIAIGLLLVVTGTAARAAAPGEAKLVADRAAIKELLEGNGGVLIFVDRAVRGKVLWVDLSDSELAIRELSGEKYCGNPILSPDGTRTLYTRGRGKGRRLFARRLSGGAAAYLGTADIGYWYVENGTEYIVSCDYTRKHQSGDGKTYRQKVKNGIEADGERTVLYDGRAMDAGITGNGRWLGETYGHSYIYDLTNKKEYGPKKFFRKDGSQEGQTCNGSMAPDGTHRFLKLVIPHDWIRVYEYQEKTDDWREVQTYDKPEDAYEFQATEWSTHPGYFTTTIKHRSDNRYHLYIVRMRDKKRLHVVAGNISNSHLYVRAAGKDAKPQASADQQKVESRD